jgi:hypothetical protein
MALMPAFAVISGLLVVAGAAKLRSPRAARDAVALLGIGVPSSVIRGLGGAELAIGVSALVWPSAVTAGLVAVAYAAFCGFVARLMRAASRPVDCGCFGDAQTGAGPVHVVLNAVACLVGAAAFLRPPPGITWIATRPPLIGVPLAIGTLTVACAAYLAFTVFPSAWRAYGAGVGR